MNQGLPLERVECARNAGVFILLRILIGFLVFVSLSTIFYMPVEAMLVAAQGVKANALFFIVIIVVLIPMSFLSLVIGFPLNNVLTTVNKELSWNAARMRFIEALIFIVGIVLLFAEIPLFYQVMLFGLVFYGLHLTLIGYLVFKSGYLSRVVGILLVIGGSLGYLLESLTGFFVPSFVWLSIAGVSTAIIAEVALGITLLLKAIRMIAEDPDPRETVRKILEDLGEATTTEIIDEGAKVSYTCKDRIPDTLIALEKDGKLTKRFSKEKKGYVWTLVS